MGINNHLSKGIVKNDVPFFIVGCPRSGTTLLQLLIDSHPNIAIPPESHIFVRFSKIFRYYGDLSKDTNLRLLIRDLLNDYHIKDWKLGVSIPEFCEMLEERTLRGVIFTLLGIYAKKEGKKRWGDKTPQHALHLKEIIKIFPKAKFIHLVRDGRDVAVSSSRTIVGPPSIYGIAKEWKKYISIFSDFKESLDKCRYHEIRYEDLVQNPQKEMDKTFHFLDEEPISIGPEVPNTAAKNYYLQTDEHMLSLKLPITTKKICSFKNVLSEREIAIFEFMAKYALRRYGYQLESTGYTEIRKEELIYFYLKDKVYRYYRKYVRPTELDKAWILARREFQFYIRTFLRSTLSSIKN